MANHVRLKSAKESVDLIRDYLEKWGGYNRLEEIIKQVNMPYVEILKPAMNVITAFYPKNVLDEKLIALFRWMRTEVSLAV